MTIETRYALTYLIILLSQWGWEDLASLSPPSPSAPFLPSPSEKGRDGGTSLKRLQR